MDSLTDSLRCIVVCINQLANVTKRAVDGIGARPFGHFVLPYGVDIPTGEGSDGNVVILRGIEYTGVIADAREGAGFASA